MRVGATGVAQAPAPAHGYAAVGQVAEPVALERRAGGVADEDARRVVVLLTDPGDDVVRDEIVAGHLARIGGVRVHSVDATELDPRCRHILEPVATDRVLLAAGAEIERDRPEAGKELAPAGKPPCAGKPHVDPRAQRALAR